MIFILIAALLTATPTPTLTKAPVLTKSVTAVYPDSEKDNKVNVEVTMEIDIDLTGHVSKVRVTSAPNAKFDEAAIVAARQLEFSPAEVDGQAAPVRIAYKTTFVPQVEIPLAQPVVNFSGVVKAAGTREPVVGAVVTAAEKQATTKSDGSFEMTDLPVGEVEVVVKGEDIETFSAKETIKPNERTQVTYAVRTAAGKFETVVRAQREVSSVRLTQKEIQGAAGSRNDAFRVIQNLPGVARSPFGGALFIVRGSKSWDSRIYVDEVQIPQLFHFAGLNATFNSDTLESINFQPGNFESAFGRSTGGLVLATVRTPSKTGIHGAVDLNFFDGSARIEAPINSTWSASASGRLGFAQWVVPFAINTFAPKIANQLSFTLAPQFWDYQVRAERRVGSSKNRIFISIFGSSDAWAFVRPNPFFDADIEGNRGAAGTSQFYNRLVVGFDHRLGSRVSLVTRNSIGFDTSNQSGTTSEVFFRTRQFPIQMRERLRIEIPEAHLEIGAGVDAVITPSSLDAQQPPTFRTSRLPDPYVTRRLVAQEERPTYIEPGLFIDALWNPFSVLEVRGGLRVDSEVGVMHKVWANPRFGVRVSPVSFLTFKAGAGLYQQPPDYRLGQLSKVFGNPRLLPEGAWQFVLGGELRLFSFLEIDVQGYYKYFFNQARQSLSSGQGSDVNIPGAETRFTSQGYGRAYGAEFFVRIRPTRYFTGWIAYTLSRFERDYYGGVAFAPGPLDQPHNFVAVGTVTLPFDFSFGARFRVASGPLVTPIQGAIYDVNANYYVPLPGLPWSKRLAPFVQFDVRVDKKFIFRSWTLIAYLDIQNVTNQQNAEALIFNFDYTQSANLTGIPILPTLGLRGEW